MVLVFISMAFIDKGFSQEINLPPPFKKGELSLEEALDGRISVRSYKEEPLRLEELSQLLWASYGKNRYAKLVCPSAGALYPLSIYVVVGKVKGLSSGVYRYNHLQHSLSLMLAQDKRPELSSACLGQVWVKEAPISIVICADYSITTRHYGSRGRRYVEMEAGHSGQNIYLMATSLGLGTVGIGAFRDLEVKQVLRLKEEPLYIFPVGRPNE